MLMALAIYDLVVLMGDEQHRSMRSYSTNSITKVLIRLLTQVRIYRVETEITVCV